MQHPPKTTRSEKTLLGVLLAALLAILVLSSARAPLVSSFINQAYATGSASSSPLQQPAP